jgi:hypothetical protein
MDRLHPETIRTLRELIKLHGADRLILAIRQIEKAQTNEDLKAIVVAFHTKEDGE